MSVTDVTGEACMSNSSTRNAVPTVQVNGKPQPHKADLPVLTHRKDDEQLCAHLRNNSEGIGFQRNEWQIPKWNNFKSDWTVLIQA